MSTPEAGYRCLVFGGSGAIGSAVCRVLSRDGAQLALTYHSGRAAAEGLSEELGGCPLRQCDLANPDDVREAVREAARELGGLDALVQAAGIIGDPGYYQCATPSNYGSLEKIQTKDFDRMMDVNVRSTLVACQEGAACLREAGGGNIILVGSIDSVKTVPAPVHFASANSALCGMVGSMCKELGNYNIRVNLVAPGVLDSGSSRVLSSELTEPYLAHCALGRFGTAEEVAEVVGWLALNNTYVTGQSILLDGGL